MIRNSIRQAKRTIGIAALTLALSISVGTAQAQSNTPYVSPARLADSIDAVIRQDSQGWWLNSYDRGSVHNVRITYASPDGRGYAARATYTFNDGASGWVEMVVRDDALICLRYWDDGSCRSIKTEAAPWAPAIALGIGALAIAAAASDAANNGSSSSHSSAGSARQDYYVQRR